MSVEAVKSYIVELHMTAAGPDRLAVAAEQARLAAKQLTREGVPVRYVRSILIPGDETCFLVFEGQSAQAVGEGEPTGSARLRPDRRGPGVTTDSNDEQGGAMNIRSLTSQFDLTAPEAVTELDIAPSGRTHEGGSA